MIFNRSLSAEEVYAMYANTSSRYLEHNYTNQSDGNHTFKAYTQDLFGNVIETFKSPQKGYVRFLRVWYSVNIGESLVGISYN